MVKHGEADSVLIRPGERASVNFSFVVPELPMASHGTAQTHLDRDRARGEELFVIMESWQGTKKVYTEDRIRLHAAPRP